MAKIKGLDKLKRDLDPDDFIAKVLKIVADEHAAEIIDEVIGSAKKGKGPGDQDYPPLSAAYAAKFKGQRKTFLSVVGTLLDTQRFSLTAKGTTLTQKWEGDDKLGIIATVHNDGLPIGRGGPVKQREFVHFESRNTLSKLWNAIELAAERVTREFNRG